MAFALSSCGSMKQLFMPLRASATAEQPDTSLHFIENFEIKSADNKAVPPVVTETERSGSQEKNGMSLAKLLGNNLLETFSPMQFKYALRLDVPVELVQNLSLYAFIDEWWGTPYRLGGNSRNGIDCSGFVQALMMGVFSLQLPRTSREQKNATQPIDDASLKEGDLVFFSTNRRGYISHVGIYLHNRKFVHASTSGGVMISDLDEPYWSRHYRGAGRVLNDILP